MTVPPLRSFRGGGFARSKGGILFRRAFRGTGPSRRGARSPACVMRGENRMWANIC